MEYVTKISKLEALIQEEKDLQRAVLILAGKVLDVQVIIITDGVTVHYTCDKDHLLKSELDRVNARHKEVHRKLALVENALSGLFV